jgi:hypothetical protein
MSMHKVHDWPFGRSLTAVFGETIIGHPYDEELAGPGGMHFHLWLPERVSKEHRDEIESYLRNNRDVQAISWEPLTKEAMDWLRSKSPAVAVCFAVINRSHKEQEETQCH